jgi:hypothetical protein
MRIPRILLYGPGREGFERLVQRIKSGQRLNKEFQRVVREAHIEAMEGIKRRSGSALDLEA